MENSGFYKKQKDGTWLYAQNEVTSPDYSISKQGYEENGVAENKDGWVWHDTAPKEYTAWVESEKNKPLELPKII